MADLEIEAQFSIPHPGLFEKYMEITEIAKYRIGVCREVHVVDDYLDTQQQDIWAAGFNLRVRESRGARFITVKSAESRHSQFSVREQIEFPVGDEIDIEHWGNETARKLIKPLIDGRVLRTTVQLRQIRGERRIYSDNASVAMLSMDQVQVWRQGAHLDHFHVLEVELLHKGEQHTLEKICTYLQSEGLVRQTVSKLERAFEIVSPPMAGAHFVD